MSRHSATGNKDVDFQNAESERQLATYFSAYIGRLAVIFDPKDDKGDPAKWSLDDKLKVVDNLLSMPSSSPRVSMPELDDASRSALKIRLASAESNREDESITVLALPILLPVDTSKRKIFGRIAYEKMPYWQIRPRFNYPTSPLIAGYSKDKPDIYSRLIEPCDEEKERHPSAYLEYEIGRTRLSRTDYLKKLMYTRRGIALSGMSEKDPSRCILTVPIVEFSFGNMKSRPESSAIKVPRFIPDLLTPELMLILHAIYMNKGYSVDTDVPPEPVNELISIKDANKQTIRRVAALALPSRQIDITAWDPSGPAYTRGQRIIRKVSSGIGNIE